MRSILSKWAPPILIAAALALSAAVSGWLPEQVVLRFDDLLPFTAANPPGPVPRWLILTGMPAGALLLWAGFRLAPTRTGQRVARRMFPAAPDNVTSPEQFDRFGSTYDTIVLGIVALMLGGHMAILAAALGWPAIAARLVPVAIGGSVLLMGNVMPRLWPNWVAGIRTRRTLADPNLWRATHRAFGTAFVLAGLVTIAVGLVAPRLGVLVGLGGIIAASVVGFVASRGARGTASLAAAVLLCATAHGAVSQTQPPRPVEIDPPASVAESAYTFMPLAPSVVPTIAGWINAGPAAAPPPGP